MIYLDNAATTFPKPPSVINSMAYAMRKYGANPGRSGHELAMKSSIEIYNCRKLVNEFFGGFGEESVVFTLNCTHASNIVLKGLLKPGDHVVVSCLEHNSIMRPLKKLEKEGISYTLANVYVGDNDATVDSFRKSLNKNTRLIVCMHASNVWGIRLPIERISALANEYKIPFLVDAAQTAGVLPINMKEYNIDYLCTAGHKGLYGPMGTGILIAKDCEKVNSLMEGGTGTSSLMLEQPSEMPDKFESGTPNMPGIVGLKAGIEYIQRRGMENIARHEYMLINRLYDRLSNMDKIELYMPRPEPRYFAPLLSFNVKGKDSETVSRYLNTRGIATRAGIHCAPTAHEFCKTMDRGAVRVCPSAFTKTSEIDYFVSEIRRMQ